MWVENTFETKREFARRITLEREIVRNLRMEPRVSYWGDMSKINNI